MSAIPKRCQYCLSFSIERLHGDGKEWDTFTHQPSFSALRLSAESGCDLCGYFIRALTYNGRHLPPYHYHEQRRNDEPESPVLIEVHMGNISNPRRDEAVDRLVLTMTNIGSARNIALFTKRRESKSPLIRGREITRNPNSLFNFEDAKRWIHECTNSGTSHRECPHPADMSFPTRLINVGDKTCEPFIQLTRNMTGKYAALSYCWGTSPPFTTTMGNLTAHLQSIPMAKLPQTIQDGITITRELGLQYLWVDALCILQPRYLGDTLADADWQAEGSQMASVFGNAFLTISAGSASDKASGIFHDRPVNDTYFEIPYYASPDLVLEDESQRIKVYARLEVGFPCSDPDPKLQPTTSSRAWCFQETFLAPRTLQYSPLCMWYNCHCRQLFESGARAEPEHSLVEMQHCLKNPKENNLSLWRAAVVDFSRRDIGRREDRLIAISGVAERLSRVIGGRYIAGLWEQDFLRGLGWRTVLRADSFIGREGGLVVYSRLGWRGSHEKGRVPYLHDGREEKENGEGEGGKEKTKMEYLAPSWSWVSRNGPVDLLHATSSLDIKTQYYARLIAVDVQLAPPRYAPFGAVVGGTAELVGPMMCMRVAGRKGRGDGKAIKQFSFVLNCEDKLLLGDLYEDGDESPQVKEVECLLLLEQTETSRYTEHINEDRPDWIADISKRTIALALVPLEMDGDKRRYRRFGLVMLNHIGKMRMENCGTNGIHPEAVEGQSKGWFAAKGGWRV